MENKFVNPSLEVVSEAFRGFEEQIGLSERGGFIREGVKTHHSPEPNTHYDSIAPYHVEQSFKGFQGLYIMQAARFLERDANGLGQDKLSFGDRVRFNFSGQGDPLRYTAALIDSAMALYQSFMAEYPNYFPAFRALMIRAGALGTKIAIENERLSFWLALGGNLNEKSIYKLNVPAPKDYIDIHTKRSYTPGQLPNSDEYSYEVWCSGRTFAISLMNQSRRAALDLAKDPHLVERYDPTLPEEVPDDLARKFLSLVRI